MYEEETAEVRGGRRENIGAGVVTLLPTSAQNIPP